MKSYLVALLGPVVVDRINIGAQIALLLCAAAGFYEARTHRAIKGLFDRLSGLQKYVWFGKWGMMIGTPRDHHGEEFPGRVYLLTSAIILSATVLSGHGLAYWALYPLRQFAEAAFVWGGLSFSDWRSVFIPFHSLFLLLWGILTMVTLYPGGFGIPLKTTLLTADWMAQRFTEARLHLILFLMTIFAGLIVIASSMDWNQAKGS